MVAKREHWISPEEYLALDRASLEAKYEYIDGHMYPVRGGTINLAGETVNLAGGSLAHMHIARNIGRILDTHLQGGSCHVYSSDMRVQLAEKRYVYPDISVSCDPEDWNEEIDIIRSPRLIVEVLSPGTEAYDRGEKFLRYQGCPTIQEYVLINTRRQIVEVYRRQDEWWIYHLFTPGQEAELASIGLKFPISALYEGLRIPAEEE